MIVYIVALDQSAVAVLFASISCLIILSNIHALLEQQSLQQPAFHKWQPAKKRSSFFVLWGWPTTTVFQSEYDSEFP
jgi:hypothetical protein